MKKLLMILAFYPLLQAGAQQQSGKITYEHVLSLKKLTADNNTPSSPLAAQIAAMIPAEQRNTKLLYYTTEASLYESTKDNEPEELNKEGVTIKIHREVSDDKLYTDLKNGRKIHQRDLMGRMFLVTDELKPAKWRFTGRQKMILDQACMEAFLLDEEADSVIAWYAPALPVSTGPEGMGGLPGLILEAAMGKGITIRATRIEPGGAVAGLIRQPVKGKKITEAEFAALAKKKQEEMAKEYGGNGQVMFKVIQR